VEQAAIETCSGGGAGVVGLGGVLMALAPEIWAGLLVLALGVLIELAGIALERQP